MEEFSQRYFMHAFEMGAKPTHADCRRISHTFRWLRSHHVTCQATTDPYQKYLHRLPITNPDPDQWDAVRAILGRHLEGHMRPLRLDPYSYKEDEGDHDRNITTTRSLTLPSSVTSSTISSTQAR